MTNDSYSYSDSTGSWYKFYDPASLRKSREILSKIASPEKQNPINLGFNGASVVNTSYQSGGYKECPNGVCHINTSEQSSRGSTTPY